MEIVVALLALEAGLIMPHFFVAIVFSAVLSSMIMGPWMSKSLMRRAVTAAEFLDPESVISGLAATTRMSAIEELAACIARYPDAALQGGIAQEAMVREREFGTAIGDGVAIPHLRIEGPKSPIVAFGRSKDGIDWNAPDGMPVHYVFFLRTPEGTADPHVQILASVAQIMQSPENRHRLASAPDSASLVATLKTLLCRGIRQQEPNKPDADGVE